VGSEEERSAGAADGVEFAEGGVAVLAAGDLHEAVEEEESSRESGSGKSEGRRPNAEGGNGVGRLSCSGHYCLDVT
jgi:hypothetical protein